MLLCDHDIVFNCYNHGHYLEVAHKVIQCLMNVQ